MSIGKKASKGFTSFLYRNLLEKIVGVGAMIVLARKLSPYDFGLVSITEVLLYIISVFGTAGLAEFLLAYRKDDTREIFKSAFWFNIAISGLILLVFWIAIPFWSYYNDEPRIWKLSILTGFIFLFSQLQVIPKTWLSKHLEFDKQVKIQAPFIVLTALGKVVAVYLNFGVYSLLIPTLLFQPILTLLLYRAAAFKPNLHFYTNRWKEIFRFTKHLIGANVLSRIADQGDKIILGKMLGLEVLGIYNIASQIADLVTTQFVAVSNNVLSSVLPKYVHDKEKFYAHYMTFLKTFAFLVFPFLGIMLVAARPIILFVYGAKWESAILPMQILLVYAAFRVVTSSYGSVMNSFHLTKKSFKIAALHTPVHLLGSLIGSLFGIAGVALSVVVVKIIFVNINIRQVMDAVAKPLANWYKDLLPYFLNTSVITCILVTGIYASSMFRLLSPIFSITIISLSFIAAYYLIFKLFFKNELQRISAFLGITFPKTQFVFNFLFRI